MSSEQSNAEPKPAQAAHDPCVFFIAQCARWETLAICIEAAYDTPSWIGEAIQKVREANR